MAGKATDSEWQPPDLLSENDMEDEDEGEWSEEEDKISTLPESKSAEISRVRSHCRSGKETTKGRPRTRGGQSTKMKRINPMDRIREFPNEYLSVSAGKLFCDVCHVVVQSKKSVVKVHVLSARHALSKERKAKASIHQATLTKSWK